MQPAIVLCLEKQEALLHLLESTLSTNSYSVMTARTGQQVLHLAAAHPLDAVVLDYELRDMKGEDVAREVKRLRPKAQVVMFSEKENLPSSKNMPGVDGLVRKGESINALLGILHRLCQRPGPEPLAFRRFPRYPVQWPLSIVVDDAGKKQTLEGVSTTISEGGIGGTINGTLIPGQEVLLHISRPPGFAVQTRRAQVRYHHADGYGFAFLDAPLGEKSAPRNQA